MLFRGSFRRCDTTNILNRSPSRTLRWLASLPPLLPPLLPAFPHHLYKWGNPFQRTTSRGSRITACRPPTMSSRPTSSQSHQLHPPLAPLVIRISRMPRPRPKRAASRSLRPGSLPRRRSERAKSKFNCILRIIYTDYIMHRQKCFEAWSKENEGGLNAFNTAWGRLSKEQKQVSNLQSCTNCPADTSGTQEFAKTLLSVRRLHH
jgi:hypothetical protein